MEQIQNILIEKLVESPYQGRFILTSETEGVLDDKNLSELKNSIDERGLMTPIVVRSIGDGFEIIDGHRRVAAYKLLSKTHIEAIVESYGEDSARVFSLVGNIMRKNLSLIEKAIAFKKVKDSGAYPDFKAIAIAIGKDETFVRDITNTLYMDQRIIDDLTQHKTTEDARLLRAIRGIEKAKKDKTDHPYKSDKQWELYDKFKKEGLTRDALIQMVKDQKQAPEKPFSIGIKKRSVLVKVNQNLTDEQQKQLQKFISDKLTVLMAAEKS